MNVITMHFKGNEELVARILDLQEKAKRYQRPIFTPFLNENEQEIVKKVASDSFVYADGGYDNAERKCMAISYYEEEIAFPVVCLKAKWQPKYQKLSHRDVLGSLMHLGIERDVIGDIAVEEDMIYVFVKESIVSFLLQEWRSIGRHSVTFQICEERVELEKKMAYEERIVSSYRLDAIVACIAKVNREKAKMMIRGGGVKVNQVVLEESSHLCNNKDVISIRGTGRFVLYKSERKTKKNRLVIEIGRYI